MTESDVFVSTRQAARILNVHESSIKRWCNDGQLDARLTQGGHRRLPFGQVLEFARSQKIESPILSFAPYELRVWRSVQDATRGKFEDAVSLLFSATAENRESFAQQLTTLLLESGVEVGPLFDKLFGPVLREIGDQWLAGRVSTGDEHRMTQILSDCIATVRNRRPIVASTKPNALVACAPGENHELGALMVRAALEHNGWQTVYLGRNAPTEDIANQQRRWDVRLVCVSFIPPHGPADAQMLVRALARSYDNENPYSLAIGGGTLGAFRMEDPEHPFVDFARFGSISDFNKWAAAVAAAVSTQPEPEPELT